MKTQRVKQVKKQGFRIQVRSKHPSHAAIRNKLGRKSFRSIVRLGSTTDLDDTVTNGGKRVEVNTLEAIRNSSNKLLMKQCFDKAGVKTAVWCKGNVVQDYINNKRLVFPIVAKSHYGSRGTGNYLLTTQKELDTFLKQHSNLNEYIFEKYFTGTREYRLHVTKEGCFYAIRKMIKSDTPKDERWYRNDSNCAWITEYKRVNGANGKFSHFSAAQHPDFDKPVNWSNIIQECIKALNSVGLQIGGIDLKVQSAEDGKGKKRSNPEFIVLETNSAPSMGEITEAVYIEQISKLLDQEVYRYKIIS